MKTEVEYPWPQISDFILTCGFERTPRSLAIKILAEINKLVPYDQARIYSLNVEGEVCDDVLFGVDNRWPSSYYQYYSKILNGKYSLARRIDGTGRRNDRESSGVYDWINCDCDEFVSDYIRPQGIRYSYGFGLRDMNDRCKRLVMMDRLGLPCFSDVEMRIMATLIEHLSYLHRNFYFNENDESAVGRKGTDEALTPRETEIANLIRKGYSPKLIAKKLFVSRTTVYKHITHIHAKLGVSTNQELLVKLFCNQ